MIAGQMSRVRCLWLRSVYGLLTLIGVAAVLQAALALVMIPRAHALRDSALHWSLFLYVGLVNAFVSGVIFWLVCRPPFRIICTFRYAEGRLSYVPIFPRRITRDLAEIGHVKEHKRQAIIYWRMYRWLANARELAEQLARDCERKAPADTALTAAPAPRPAAS